MPGVERTVATTVTARVDGYVTGMRRCKDATRDFSQVASSSAQKNKADWDALGNKALVAGGAIALAVGKAVKTYMDFDAAMSRVAAVSGATASEQKALAQAALDAGQASVFSASEAAQAQEELAKAGISTADIIGGALSGSLDLAAAGGLDLAKSAEISAQAMNLFSLQGKDVAHIADVLTAGANKSAAGVDDLGAALSQGGLVAKQTGLSLEETVGALSAFADNALKGSDAGTSLKTMLQWLTPQSKEAATLMDELGIHAYDAAGQFVGLAEFADQLKNGLSKLTPEQRNAAMATMFGSDAVRAANVLYEQGAAGVREYTKAVDDNGAAQRMAARMTDNLKGDVEQLSGALETAFIKGGSGANDGLRSIVQGLTGAVKWASELPPELQKDAVQLAAVSAAALLATGGVLKVGAAAAGTKAQLMAMGLSAERSAKMMKGAAWAAGIGALAALTVEVQKYIAASTIADVSTDKLADSVAQLGNARLTGGIADLFRDEGGWLQSTEKWVSTADAIKRFGTVANDALGDGLMKSLARMQTGGAAVSQFEKYVDSLDAALADLVANGHADEAKRSLDQLMQGVDPAVADDVRGKFEQYAAAVDQLAAASQNADPAMRNLTAVQQGQAAAAKSAADATSDWAETLDALNSPALSARDAARNFEAALDDAAAKAKAAKEEGLSYRDALDAGTEAGRENQAALDGVAAAALSQISALQANGASQGTLQATLETSRDRLYKAARSFGMGEEAARRYTDEVLGVPTSAQTTVYANTGTALSNIQNLSGALTRINGKTATTYVWTVYKVAGQPGASIRGGQVREDGGLTEVVGGRVRHFADGGGYSLTTGAYVPRISQIVRGGMNILWGEPVTGWEAYISGKPEMRRRNLGLWAETGRRLGIDPQILAAARVRNAFADGEFVVGQQFRRSYAAPAPAAMGGFPDARDFARAVGSAVHSALAGVRVDIDGDRVGRLVTRYQQGLA